MGLMIEKLLGFVLVLTRISAFFAVIPIFNWQSIPVRIKTAMILLVSIFFSMMLPLHIKKDVSTLEASLLIANEVIYGFAMGLIVTLVFSAVKVSGLIIEREMGLAMAEILDPLTEESAQAMSIILEMSFILLFLSANGHHFFLLTIQKSYETFPAGSTPTIPSLVRGVIEAGSTLLTAGLKLAAPIFGALFVLIITLAVLARITPEMNVFFISFPITISVGLLMATAFLPFIFGFVNEFADYMSKLLPL